MNNINYRYPKGIQVGAAVVIENSENKILIARTPKLGNQWTIPGGHLNPGETIEEGAIREALEETGIKIKVKKIIRHCEVLIKKEKGDSKHLLSFHVYGKVEDDSGFKLDNLELTESKWVSPEEAHDLIEFEDFKETIKEFIKLRIN